MHEVKKVVVYEPAPEASGTPAVSSGPSSERSTNPDTMVEKLRKRTAEIEALRRPLTAKQRKELKIEAARKNR